MRSTGMKGLPRAARIAAPLRPDACTAPAPLPLQLRWQPSSRRPRCPRSWMQP